MKNELKKISGKGHEIASVIGGIPSLASSLEWGSTAVVTFCDIEQWWQANVHFRPCPIACHFVSRVCPCMISVSLMKSGKS